MPMKPRVGSFYIKAPSQRLSVSYPTHPQTFVNLHWAFGWSHPCRIKTPWMVAPTHFQHFRKMCFCSWQRHHWHLHNARCAARLARAHLAVSWLARTLESFCRRGGRPLGVPPGPSDRLVSSLDRRAEESGPRGSSRMINMDLEKHLRRSNRERGLENLTITGTLNVHIYTGFVFASLLSGFWIAVVSCHLKAPTHLSLIAV